VIALYSALDFYIINNKIKWMIPMIWPIQQNNS